VARPLPPERAASGVAAREAALRMLARGSRTEHEIAERLLLRGFEPAAVRDAVERLRRVSLLDDRAFLRSFLRRELLRRTESGTALRMRLRRRGVPAELLGDLDALIAEDPDLAAESLETEEGRARRALAELKRKAHGRSPEERRRLTGALKRRGFSWDVIRDIVTGEEDDEPNDTADD
jgi:SOS response regulatory protein OraA/RecX